MSGLRDALLCELTALALRYGAGALLLPLALAFATFFLGLVVRRAVGRAPSKEGSATRGPHWVFASWICAGLYGLGRIVDPLLRGRLVQPEGVPDDIWAHVGYFEWRLFGSSPILRLVLPLVDQPAVALALHALVWGTLFFLLATGLTRFSARLFTRSGELAYDQPEDDLPFYFRWTGATTARRADHKTRGKLTLLVTALLFAHGITGGLLATSAPAPAAALTCDGEHAGFTLPEAARDLPAGVLPTPLPLPLPGTFVVLGLALMVFALHLVSEGTPRAEPEKVKEAVDPASVAEQETTTERFRAALLARGIQLEDPSSDWRAHEDAALEGETAPPPAGTHPLFADVLQRLVGEGARLHRHQAEVLAHLLSAWRAHRAETRGAAPRLEEAALASTFLEKSDHAHPLVLTAEGSGRTSLGLFAALLVVLDRGATAVVLTRRKDDARALGRRIKGAIEKSALRWNLSVAVAGDDLASQLASGRLPNIVLADLETFESELLSDVRTDALLSRLGLLVVDDLDAFVGVPEMHLFVAMRRFWALSRTLRDAPYPLLLLALAGPSAEGMLPWARHLLAAPLALFDADTAPRRALVHVRRRDLAIDPEQASTHTEPTVADLASAAAAGKLRWHLRLAGDERRRTRRAHVDLESIPGHADDPALADVVILEGRHPDVAREAKRIVHAGLGRPGEVVIVHAPPPDEDTVLVDLAIDSKERELTASLPRAVPLSLPALMRQRHFDRALGREHDVEALEDRFGRRFVDETLAALERAGRITQRTVWQFDARTDDAVPRVRIRSVHEAALGEPILETTVGESKTRVALIDEGTAEVLTEVDGAIALALFPPGAVFLAPEGRYQVRGESEQAGRRTITLQHGRPPLFSSPVRRAQIEASAPLEWAERTLGGARMGKPLLFCAARVEVTEALSGMRVHLPGAVLLERRTYERAIVATYSTEACVVAVATLEPASEAPLLAALRRALPWLVRSAEGALDAEIDTVDGRRALVFFDRTPGGSGLARALEAELLGDALRLARRVLERLVEGEMDRLRAVYDSRAASDDAWNVGGALAFLDGLLDGTRAERSRETFGYAKGEGTPGDLGRVWIAPSGRTDDLSWVRHAFSLPRAIGSAPSGDVSLDVGVERSEARRRDATKESDALIFGTLRMLLEKIAGDERGADELALHWVAGVPLSRSSAGTSGARLALIERRADAEGRAALLMALAKSATLDGSIARVAGSELDLSARGASVRPARTSA